VEAIVTGTFLGSGMRRGEVIEQGSILYSSQSSKNMHKIGIAVSLLKR